MAQEPVKIRRVDFYPVDWLEGTIGLRDDERGVYIQAIMLIYARGGPITKELLKSSCSSHGNALNRIISNLEKLGKIIGNDSEIDQKRCGKELEKARKRAVNDGKTTACEPTRAGARATPSSFILHPSSKNPPKSPKGDLDCEKMDEAKKPPRPKSRAHASNSPIHAQAFNLHGVTEHRPAFADLRDPVEIAIKLGLRDHHGKLVRQ